MDSLCMSPDRDTIDASLRLKCIHRARETRQAKIITILLTVAATASIARFIMWLCEMLTN